MAGQLHGLAAGGGAGPQVAPVLEDDAPGENIGIAQQPRIVDARKRGDGQDQG